MDKSQSVVWAESLPPGCPPPDASQPYNDTYYRLVDSIPPQASDFYSTRMLYPDRKINDECIARAVSLFSTLDSCIMKQRLPILKNKKILKITLPPESGLIKRTSKDHWSWWRLLNFDIIKHCQVNND